MNLVRERRIPGIRRFRLWRTAAPPAPVPSVPGTRAPGVGDLARVTCRQVRAHVYRVGLTTLSPARRLASLALAVWTAAIFPALVLARAIHVRVFCRRSAFYLTSDAALAVTSTRKGWRLAEHYCATPGTGQGRALRIWYDPRLLMQQRRPAFGSTARLRSRGCT
jgi:hypothetical protein